ncbi:MAG: hypothetical protein JKY98_04145 [Gammaproteobacteria bacterium]|nr:hypothetical protein [Gammaproteobacteria bacterium]
MMNRDRAKELQDVFNHFADGGEVEVEDAENRDDWYFTHTIMPDRDNRYRISVTKPSIDWSHVHEDYKWLAIDKDSIGYILHEMKPEISGSIWSSRAREITASNFTSFKPGTCDWKDSLVERPE